MKGAAPHVIEFRVRYQETDAQGRVHHANYLNYFEIGRVELLRANGLNYRELEASGIFLVVAEASCRYYLPANYDDVVALSTKTVRAKGARVEHRYELRRDQDLLAAGHTIVACVDTQGRARRLPAVLLELVSREG